MDSIPTELLELQTHFETWRANRNHVRESLPDELRSAALDLSRRYPPSLIQRILKVAPSRLKKKPVAKRSATTTTTLKKKPAPTRSGVPKQKLKPSTRREVATLHQPAFFKLPDLAALPLDSPSQHTPASCRIQLERPDGSRLTLTLPGLDVSIISSLVADFWLAGKR
jgi:hypothetical protein